MKSGANIATRSDTVIAETFVKSAANIVTPVRNTAKTFRIGVRIVAAMAIGADIAGVTGMRLLATPAIARDTAHSSSTTTRATPSVRGIAAAYRRPTVANGGCAIMTMPC